MTLASSIRRLPLKVLRCSDRDLSGELSSWLDRLHDRHDDARRRRLTQHGDRDDDGDGESGDGDDRPDMTSGECCREITTLSSARNALSESLRRLEESPPPSSSGEGDGGGEGGDDNDDGRNDPVGGEGSVDDDDRTIRKMPRQRRDGGGGRSAVVEEEKEETERVREALGLALEYHSLLAEFEYCGFPMQRPPDHNLEDAATPTTDRGKATAVATRTGTERFHRRYLWSSAFGGEAAAGGEGGSDSARRSKRRRKPAKPPPPLDLRYEKCATLFNVAALKGRLAAASHFSAPPPSEGGEEDGGIDENDGEGREERWDPNAERERLARANELYAQSVAVFRRLREAVVAFDGGGKNAGKNSGDEDDDGQSKSFPWDEDMSLPVLEFCETFMLSMGQCCIYETARLPPPSTMLTRGRGGVGGSSGPGGRIRGKPQHFLLSKIAAGVSQLGEASSKLLRGRHPGDGEDEGKGEGEARESDHFRTWSALLESVSCYHLAAAAHHESARCREKRRRDEEAAWLAEAARYCLEAAALRRRQRPCGEFGGKGEEDYDGGGDDNEAMEERRERGCYDDNDPLLEKCGRLSRELFRRMVEAEKEREAASTTNGGDLLSAPTSALKSTPPSVSASSIRGHVMVKVRPSPAIESTLGKELDRTYYHAKGAAVASEGEGVEGEEQYLQRRSLFRDILSAPAAQEAYRIFRRKAAAMTREAYDDARAATSDVRTALANVDLPRKLVGYRAASSTTAATTSSTVEGGGRGDNGRNVEEYGNESESEKGNRSAMCLLRAFQESDELLHLRENLEDFRDLSEGTWLALSNLGRILDDDRRFLSNSPRTCGGSIGGVGVEAAPLPRDTVFEAQRSIRSSAAECAMRLDETRGGDEVLMRFLEAFDVDEGLRLLRLDGDEIERRHRLSMAAAVGGGSSVDTTQLGELLVKLSNVLRDQEVLLGELFDYGDSRDLKTKLKAVDPNSDDANRRYAEATGVVISKCDRVVFEIRRGMDEQTELLDNVLEENDAFVHALLRGSSQGQGRSSGSSGRDIFQDVEVALSTVLRVQRHLDEGLKFYDAIEVRIEELYGQASAVGKWLAEGRRNRESAPPSVATLEPCDLTPTGGDGGRESAKEATVQQLLPPVRESNPADACTGGRRHDPEQAVVYRPTAAGTNRSSTRRRRTGSPSVGADAHAPRRLHCPDGSNVRPSPQPRHHDKIIIATYPLVKLTSFPNETDESHCSSVVCDARERASFAGYPGAQQQRVPSSSEKNGAKKKIIRVEDGKVASVVAMGFDPEKAFLALQMHDNNLEAAVNELLSV